MVPVMNYRTREEQPVEDIYHRIYAKLERMGVLEIRQYAVIEKPPFIPLCIDHIGEDCYALSQNRIIEGSVIADPDMEIRIDYSRKTAEPVAYQDRAVRKVVYPEPGMVNLRVKNELASLLDKWLDELLSQGFIHQQ
jgi:uncharacterized protein YqiB (DUF1249 family)